MTLGSCEPGNDNPTPEPELPQTVGAFILNRGNWNENNASLSYYNLQENAMITNVYQAINQRGLGDSAEQILLYGSKMYITVTNSNRLAILDEAGNELKSITPKEGDNTMNPRHMVADNGKVYVSYYYGHKVAALDTASLEIGETVSVGRYPEQLAISGGKLYVANSGGLDFPDNYGHTVSVVNLSTFTVDREIDVCLNPVRLAADSQGDVYVISMGNYADVPNTLQRIDAQTGQATEIGKGSLFALVNDKLYVVYASYANPDISFRKYDALTETLESDSFIAGGTTFSSISALGVDPHSGEIYIADAENYAATGTLHIFSADGQRIASVDTGGPDPSDIVFRTR
jgi:DNA-binding beta-propeller fold protein YncE